MKQKLFITCELVNLAVALGSSAFVWFTQYHFKQCYPIWFIWIVQPIVVMVVLSAITWAWAWNRKWGDFYW